MKGFTLVETLVAIAIILIAIVGPFVSVEHAVTASYVTRDELIGNSLAQEGVEYIRSIRDGDYLYNHANPGAPQNWLAGIDGTTNNSGLSVNCITTACTVDPLATVVSQTVAACSGVCSSLYTTTANTYTQQASGNTATRFTRSVQFCYINGTACNGTYSNEARVTVTVSWITNNVPYSTTIVEYLDHWLG